MELDFAKSPYRGHDYSDYEEIKELARVLVHNEDACTEVIRTWNTLCPSGPDRGIFRKLCDPLRFVDFDGQLVLKDRILQAVERLSDLFSRKVTEEGEDSGKVNRDMRSALCEELTFVLLTLKIRPKKLVRDAWAYDGHSKILPDNKANLDFARATMLNRDMFWEVFECKQNPIDFFAPYRYRYDTEQRAKHEWERSQVRLAIAILDKGGPNIVIRIVCYRSQVEIDSRMRHIRDKPPRIGIYSLGDAINRLPFCNTDAD